MQPKSNKNARRILGIIRTCQSQSNSKELIEKAIEFQRRRLLSSKVVVDDPRGSVNNVVLRVL